MNDNKYIIELLKVRSVSAGKAVEIIDTLLEIETIKKNITTPEKVSGGSHE
jgi:hypothetical protein